MDPQDSRSTSPWAWGFQPGDRVRIVDGTFRLMTGRILSYEQAQESHRAAGLPRHRPYTPEVWVLLELFGRPVPVALLLSQVEHA